MSQNVCCEKGLSITGYVCCCLWGTFQESHFFDDWWVVWFVVINGDAKGTGHQGERESDDYADVRYGIFQPGEAFAVDIEQQRHQAQARDTGAGSHDDAGTVSEREEALLDWHAWNVNVSNATCKARLLFCRNTSVCQQPMVLMRLRQ